MLASASAHDYSRAIAALASCAEVDAIIVIFTPPLVTKAPDVIRAIQHGARDLPRPIPLLSVFMSRESAPRVVRARGVGVPHYPFPEEAARALSLAARYGAWRELPDEAAPALDHIDHDRAVAVIASALVEGGGWMTPRAIGELLACYAIPLIETRFADSPRAAGREARSLASPVALKAIVPGLLHKSDAGAVRLDLNGERAVQRAAADMAAGLERSGHKVAGYEVQPIAAKGVEMLVGVVQDQHFGPVLACGAGGTATELVGDVAVRITPITRGEAARMIRSLKTFPLLDGYRGAAVADVGALEEILLRVSALVEAHPEAIEMDLNPVIVHAAGAVAVDARIRLEPSLPRPPLGAR
jgi:acyl-CoA synthetase (NDP forming)